MGEIGCLKNGYPTLCKIFNYETCAQVSLFRDPLKYRTEVCLLNGCFSYLLVEFSTPAAHFWKCVTTRAEGVDSVTS